VEDIFSRVDVDNLPLIIAEAGEKWSRGVVGLVASRVVEKFYRPAFVAEINEDKIVGSVRGIEGINVVKILDQLSDLLDHYGGHSMAGGFSLNKDKWDVFRSRLAEIAKDTVQTENLDRELQIDTIALPIELELSLWDKWALLEPYGLGNEEPVLVSNGLNLKSKRIIGKTGDHLKLTFEDNGKYIDALWWKNADKTSELTVGKRYDLAYKINLNEYRDKRSIDMIVVDMKNSV
jgi:single-stranded-DNA-specific exonuclease